MSSALISHLSRIAFVALCLLGLGVSCDWENRIQALEAAQQKLAPITLLETQATKQAIRDADQDQRIDDAVSKLACDHPDVHEFIKQCGDSGLKCDNAKVVSAVRSMQKLDHVMLRAHYVPDQDTLAILSERRKAQIATLFQRRHSIIPGVTKLLIVVIASPERLGSKRAATKITASEPKAVPVNPSVDLVKLDTQARKLRNLFIEAPYNLPKGVKLLNPQVPRCDSKTDDLIKIFHEIPDDRLDLQEARIPRPWVDLLIFLVDC